MGGREEPRRRARGREAGGQAVAESAEHQQGADCGRWKGQDAAMRGCPHSGPRLTGEDEVGHRCTGLPLAAGASENSDYIGGVVRSEAGGARVLRHGPARRRPRGRRREHTDRWDATDDGCRAAHSLALTSNGAGGGLPGGLRPGWRGPPWTLGSWGVEARGAESLGRGVSGGARRGNQGEGASSSHSVLGPNAEIVSELVRLCRELGRGRCMRTRWTPE